MIIWHKQVNMYRFCFLSLISLFFSVLIFSMFHNFIYNSTAFILLAKEFHNLSIVCNPKHLTISRKQGYRRGAI